MDPLSWLAAWVAKRGLDSTYTRVLAWFKNESPRKVLIIGPGGVGKSTLGAFLSAKERADCPPGEYVESLNTETYSLADDPKVQIVVPPGQQHRMDATWDSVMSDLKVGQFRGVILILAYGHHTVGDFTYKNHRLYNETNGLEAFVRDYVSDCLAIEKGILIRISEAINRCNQPIWLLTLVTKQDLWWTDQGAVEKHYGSGSYADIVKQCLGDKSGVQFRHEQVFVSLVIRNLMTGRGEFLKGTASGYDMPMQHQSVERLLQVFEGLMQWEQQHASSK